MSSKQIESKRGKPLKLPFITRFQIQSSFGGGKTMKKVGRMLLFGAICAVVLVYGLNSGVSSAPVTCYQELTDSNLKEAVSDVLISLKHFTLVHMDRSCLANPVSIASRALPFQRSNDFAVVPKVLSLQDHNLFKLGSSNTFQTPLSDISPTKAAFRITSDSICGSIFSPDEGGWSFIEPLRDLLGLALNLPSPSGSLASTTSISSSSDLISRIPADTYIVYNSKGLFFNIDVPEVGHKDPTAPGSLPILVPGVPDPELNLDIFADNSFISYFQNRGITDWQGYVLCLLNNVDLVFGKIRDLKNHTPPTIPGISMVLNRLEKLVPDPGETGYLRTTKSRQVNPIEYPAKLIVVGGTPSQPLIIPGSDATELDGDAVIPIYLDTSGINTTVINITRFNISVRLHPAAAGSAIASVKKVEVMDTSSRVTQSCDDAGHEMGLHCKFYKDRTSTNYDASKVTIEADSLRIAITKPLTELARVHFHGNLAGSNAVEVEVGCPLLTNCTSDPTHPTQIDSNAGLITLDSAQRAPGIGQEPDTGGRRKSNYSATYSDNNSIRPYGTLMVVPYGHLPKREFLSGSGRSAVEISPITPGKYDAAVITLSGSSTSAQKVLSFRVIQVPGDLLSYKVRASLLWTEIAEFRDVSFFNLRFHRMTTFDCNKAPKLVAEALEVGPPGLSRCHENNDLPAKIGHKISELNCGASPCPPDEPTDFSYVEIEAEKNLVPERDPSCLTSCLDDPNTVLAQFGFRGKHRGSTLVHIETNYVNALNHLCNSIAVVRDHKLATDDPNIGLDIVHFLTGRDLVKMSHTEMGDSLSGFPERNVDFIGIADGIGGYRQGASYCGKVDFKSDYPNMANNPGRNSLTQHSPNINALGSSYQPLLGIEVLLMSHEIGHNLGAIHDEIPTPSNECLDGTGYCGPPVMSPTLDETVVPLFSQPSNVSFESCIGITKNCPTLQSR